LEGEPVEVVATFETWIARHFACFHAAKAGLKGFIHSITNGLQRLTEDYRCLREPLSIPDTGALLLRFRDATRFNFVAPLPLGMTPVVPVSTDVQQLKQLVFRCWRRIQAVFESLQRPLDRPLRIV
jgi:hypothetical protein